MSYGVVCPIIEMQGNALTMLFAEEDLTMAPPGSDISKAPQITNPEKIPGKDGRALPKTWTQLQRLVEDDAEETGGDCFGYWFH